MTNAHEDPAFQAMCREQEAPSGDEQLVATLIHCSREVSLTAMPGYDLASVLSRAADRIQSFATPAAAIPAAPRDATDDLKLEPGHHYLSDTRLLRIWDAMPPEDVGEWERVHAFVNQVRLAEAHFARELALTQPTTVQQAEPFAWAVVNRDGTLATKNGVFTDKEKAQHCCDYMGASFSDMSPPVLRPLYLGETAPTAAPGDAG